MSPNCSVFMTGIMEKFNSFFSNIATYLSVIAWLNDTISLTNTIENPN